MGAFSHIRCAAKSDVGRRRKNNEDSFGVFPDAGVFCVADGMGGGDDGEVASAATVRAVQDFVAAHPPPPGVGYSAANFADGLSRAVSEASGWIYNRTQERHLNGCGSTFVAVLFDATKPGEALALHAGDSRLYRIRGRSIQRITRDHSAAEMIGAKDEDEVNPMFRGMILRAVGIQPVVEVERTPVPIRQGDRLVVCSDGLYRMVSEKKIVSILRSAQSPDAAVEALIAAANEAGGIDNVTAVLVEVGELPSALPVAKLPVDVGEAPTAEIPSGATGETVDPPTCETDTGSGGPTFGSEAPVALPDRVSETPAPPQTRASCWARVKAWLQLG